MRDRLFSKVDLETHHFPTTSFIGLMLPLHRARWVCDELLESVRSITLITVKMASHSRLPVKQMLKHGWVISKGQRAIAGKFYDSRYTVQSDGSVMFVE